MTIHMCEFSDSDGNEHKFEIQVNSQENIHVANNKYIKIIKLRPNAISE